MNNKTLKVTGAVVLSCLVMILIVIYTPKPESRDSKRRFPSKIVDTEYLKLANHAFSKAIKANGIAIENSSQLLNGEKIDFSPLIAANTASIDAIVEADTSVKQSNEEFQLLNKKDASLKILIKANTKLIASLNHIGESVETLNIATQYVKREKVLPPPSSIKKLIAANTEVTNAIGKGVKVLDKVIKAYSEYYQIGNNVN